ncbi:RNA-binding domain-containing protein [Candidatus Nitrosocosmicus hydrocola]|uniref:RNA-binding domain-containing protein n=1 Tax=Candidatus Nitrosocosmicus hydrocola TaxID=1826872 RepID=UPI001373274C|nr:RNA-binding domain-containing protein [Candidatus Nitrosocosmicus hydrocola]
MFSSLDISVLSHATEDENKITNFILEYFSKSSTSKHIENVKTEGHWKNPITRINIILLLFTNEYFEDMMNELIAVYGNAELDKYLKNNVDNKGSIYFRLDKQKLCLGKLELSDNDAVRIIFRRKGKFEK